MMKRSTGWIALSVFFVPLLVLAGSMDLYCNLICGDLDGDCAVTSNDFIVCMSWYGYEADDNQGTGCLDDLYHPNGYDDVDDVISWDWRLECTEVLNLCNLPPDADFMTQPGGGANQSFSPTGSTGYGSSLIIAGKRNENNAFSMNDKLYVYSKNKSFLGSPFSPVASRCNGRICCAPDGNVYQINSQIGLVRLNDGTAVVTPGGIAVSSDPRYNQNAIVFIGVQNDGQGEYGGRPILDVAIDAAGYVYVVPVVVKPTSGTNPAYLAAVQLQLHPGQTPGYSIVRIFDDPPALNDNQDPLRTGLREIEVDRGGNVYIISACRENSSNFLWGYTPSGAVTKVSLDTLAGVPGGIPDPIALCSTYYYDRVYLASGKNDPEATSIKVYSLATLYMSFTLARTIQINGMGHVTGIMEDLTDGTINVAGFRLQNIPTYPDPSQLPFYQPYLAQFPSLGNNNPVQATELTGSDLALPLSIAWLPAKLIGDSLQDNLPFWRTQNNIIRLTFDGDVTCPTSGVVWIQDLLDNGQYGSHVSSNFTYTLENDANNRPRIVKIRENSSSLVNKKWYAVRNTGEWKGVMRFNRQHPVQMGDANGDGMVDLSDKNLVMGIIPLYGCGDASREDINGDGDCLQDDVNLIDGFIPANPVPKPSGH